MLEYAKSIVAALGGLLMVATAAWSDKAISFDEANGIWLAVLAVLTTAGVYGVRNRTS